MPGGHLRTAAVSSLRRGFGGPGGFAIRSAGDPVVGFHPYVGEEHLRLEGAECENRELAVGRELAEPVGEVAGGLCKQLLEVARKPRRDVLGDTSFVRALRGHQRVGAGA